MKIKMSRLRRLSWIKAAGWEISGMLVFYGLYKWSIFSAETTSIFWGILRFTMYYYYDKLWYKMKWLKNKKRKI